MKKPLRPWFRAENNAWYVTYQGKQHRLAEGEANKDQAERAFHRLLADGPADPAMPVCVLFDLFLDHAQKHTAPRTYEWYRDFLQDFLLTRGKLLVAELKPFHVSKWLDSHTWEDGTRRGAITAVKRVLNWAVDEGYLKDSPLKRLKKPEKTSRTRLLTDAERAAIRAGYKPGDPWLDFLTALEESGARPGEVARVTAAQVDLDTGVWDFGLKHKTGKKTKKPRIVVLTPVLLELTRRLVQAHPTGPLFLNTHGQPWTRNAIRCRFRRIRLKLGLGNDVVAYLYRHAFVTDALTNGVPIASVAELVGHTDTKMISEHYSKLHERREHLREMAQRARPASGA